MKKLLSIVLSLLMVFATIPMTMVSAADTVVEIFQDFEKDADGVTKSNVSGWRSTKYAYEGTYSYYIKLITAVWDCQNGVYVSSSNLKNYLKIAIPATANITGNVGFYAYKPIKNGSKVDAWGVEFQDGTKYFTKFSQNTFGNLVWTNINFVGKTMYKYGDNSSKTLTVEDFNNDANKVAYLIVAQAGTTDPTYDYATYIDNVYYETSEAKSSYFITIDGEQVAEVPFGETYTIPTPAAHYVYTDGTNYYYGGEVITPDDDIDLVSEVETLTEVYTMDEGKRLYGATNYYGDALIKDVNGDNKLALKAQSDGFSWFTLPSAWSSKPYYKPTKITYTADKSNDTVKGYKTITFSETVSNGNPSSPNYNIFTTTGSLKTLPATISFDVTEDMYGYKCISGHMYGGDWKNTENDFIYIDNVTIEYVYDFDYVEPEIEGETTDVLATDEAASIRLGEVNGIRFYTTIDTEALATLVGDKEYEIGTLIAPKDLAGEYLTVEDDHIKVVYDMTNGLWEGNQVVGSIVNISESNEYNKETGNLARDFVARAYVLVDGVYYYSDTQSVRNIAAIADEYISREDSGYSDLDADLKAKVELWASAND